MFGIPFVFVYTALHPPSATSVAPSDIGGVIAGKAPASTARERTSGKARHRRGSGAGALERRRFLPQDLLEEGAHHFDRFVRYLEQIRVPDVRELVQAGVVGDALDDLPGAEARRS